MRCGCRARAMLAVLIYPIVIVMPFTFLQEAKDMTAAVFLTPVSFLLVHSGSYRAASAFE